MGKAGSSIRQAPGKAHRGPRSVLNSLLVLHSNSQMHLVFEALSCWSSSFFSCPSGSQFSVQWAQLIGTKMKANHSDWGQRLLPKLRGAHALAGIPQAASTLTTSKTVPRLRVHDRRVRQEALPREDWGWNPAPAPGVCLSHPKSWLFWDEGPVAAQWGIVLFVGDRMAPWQTHVFT